MAIQQWHINLLGLFNAKYILLGVQWYYLTHRSENKWVHAFPNGIFPKVNVIERLEFEHRFYDSVVQRCNHYTTVCEKNLGKKCYLQNM